MVHKGNIQKFTEGAFRNWGYELVREEFADVAVGWDDCDGKPGDKILVKDAIADITLQQVLTRPDEFDVIATTNLNGDYLSDALAAQVGGIGIAPGGNINYVTGHGIFEATHGTAPKYAGQDKVNPGSLLLSGRADVRAPQLAGRGRRHRPGPRGDHRREDRHLRLRPADGGRHRGQVLGVRPGHRRPACDGGPAGVARTWARPGGCNSPRRPVIRHDRRRRTRGSAVILAELNVRHTRRHMPTRRVALDASYLPMNGVGVRRRAAGGRRRGEHRGAGRRAGRAPAAAAVRRARDGLAVPRIGLRYRLQTDVHGLDLSRHRILEEGGLLIVELDVHGCAGAPGDRRGDGRGGDGSDDPAQGVARDRGRDRAARGDPRAVLRASLAARCSVRTAAARRVRPGRSDQRRHADARRGDAGRASRPSAGGRWRCSVSGRT